MSKELVCPFCQQELVEIQFGEQRYWTCINDKCSESVGFGGNLKLWQELIHTRKALDKGMEHITGLNNMIESWLNLINSDLDQETKLRILKSAISAYVENKGGNNEK